VRQYIISLFGYRVGVQLKTYTIYARDPFEAITKLLAELRIEIQGNEDLPNYGFEVRCFPSEGALPK